MDLGKLMNARGVKVRFLATFATSVARFGLGLVAGLLVAKGLGVEDYGNYAFLIGSFAAITQLLDMGTSSAFYTFISRKKRGGSFYLYYLGWVAIQFLIILLLITVLMPPALRERIWLGQSSQLILLAFLASFTMSQIWQVVSHSGESIRATVLVQVFAIVVSAFHLGFVFFMVQFRFLTIPNLCLVVTAEYLLISILLAHRLRADLIDVGESESFSEIFREFKLYCAPLVIYTWVGFAYTFADKWLLQKFGGAVQQGFFSIGQRFSMLSLMATTSMLKIFWKEIAEAREKNNLERVRRLYSKTSHLLFFVGASVSCFLVPYSREIIKKFLGVEFEEGWMCLAIMFMYPVHQSLGQISGSLFLASGKTKIYRNIGLVSMLLSIPITYFVLAPPSAFPGGLGLGAIGVAIKMVVLQMITVNVLIYTISRMYRWKFNPLYQFVSIGLLLLLTFVAKILTDEIMGSLAISKSLLITMSFSFLIYGAGVALIIYLFPWLLGVKRGELMSLVRI